MSEMPDEYGHPNPRMDLECVCHCSQCTVCRVPEVSDGLV